MSRTVRTGVEICEFRRDGSIRRSTDVGAKIWAAGSDYELDLNVGNDADGKMCLHLISLRELLALRDCLNAAITESVRVGMIPTEVPVSDGLKRQCILEVVA